MIQISIKRKPKVLPDHLTGHQFSMWVSKKLVKQLYSGAYKKYTEKEVGILIGWITAGGIFGYVHIKRVIGNMRIYKELFEMKYNSGAEKGGKG